MILITSSDFDYPHIIEYFLKLVARTDFDNALTVTLINARHVQIAVPSTGGTTLIWYGPDDTSDIEESVLSAKQNMLSIYASASSVEHSANFFEAALQVTLTNDDVQRLAVLTRAKYDVGEREFRKKLAEAALAKWQRQNERDINLLNLVRQTTGVGDAKPSVG